MAFITREDGERFVIPSYRDVIVAKTPASLKKEIHTLGGNYGEYITLQRKGPIEYEIAFSPDTGHLLGESVWHHFKRPLDMVYCEALPNLTEAILVIVKTGIVYLDGSFPIDSIAEELITFLSQQNNFDIYTYGDVPISQTPEVGKFCFESSSVRSFTVLDKPAFPQLPLLKIYQLQLADVVLSEHGIGVFPVKKAAVITAILVMLWVMWSVMTTGSKTQVTQIIISRVDPFQSYKEILSTPDPDREIAQILSLVERLFTLPGWIASQFEYANGKLTVIVQSEGSNIQMLQGWASRNNAQVDLGAGASGIVLSLPVIVSARSSPATIYPLKQVIMDFSDRLALIYPGNHLSLGDISSKSVFSQTTITITLDNLSPAVIALIGEGCKGMPFSLKTVSLKQNNGLLTGAIVLDAVGN